MEELDFEELVADAPRRFKSFTGRPIDTMPVLLSGKNSEGEQVGVPRMPVTMRQVMEYGAQGGNEHDRSLFRQGYISTASPLFIDPEGSGEVVLNLYSHPIVKGLVDSLHPKSAIIDGSLVIDQKVYKAVKDGGFVIAPDVANDLRNDKCSHPDVREKFWAYEAEGDENLVAARLKFVQEAAGGDMGNWMGLYIPSALGMRLLGAGPVGVYGGIAFGNDHLGYGLVGRLVGEAPKARAETERNFTMLEEILTIVNNPDLNRPDMVASITQKYQK